MEERHRYILNQLRVEIVRDVDVATIIDFLIAKHVIGDEDRALIRLETTNQDKARVLLDIIPKRGPKAFGLFRDSLRTHCPWISQDMDEMENQENFIPCSNGNAVPHVECDGPSPDLPPISPSDVPRTEKMKQLKGALEKLAPGGYVVLHGMKGFGKSTLATMTLKEPGLVKNLFNAEVYWIKFGHEQSTSQEILVQLNLLFHRVKNLAVLSEPINQASLIYGLKRYFKELDHRNALLVLDDVCNSNVINTFDFDCKTLVITTDIDVLEGRRCKKESIIEMNDGFTEEESLNLFAESLSINADSLPPQAKRIHEECRGMPIMIAMFAAQFEAFSESMKCNRKRWDYYLQALQTKDSEVVGESLQQQKAIFDMCIERLESRLQECYKDLAIFVEDVNITPETLEILWGQNKFKVEETMLKFSKKSLAAYQWSNGLNSYIYGVHDLLLSYLREKLNANQVRELHRSFIEKYRERCGGDFSKLPKDNYIHSYIGHHLELAELYDEFPKLYLDFYFVQAKVYHTGPGDLLIDLKKYRKFITDDYKPELVSKVEDLEKFLEEQANTLAEYRHRDCLDIIQVAMKHPYSGFVKETAQKLARQNPTSLYLHHAKQNRHYSHPSSEEVCTEVCTACYTEDSNKILIGNDRGEINLWDCENRQTISFLGHNKEYPIRKMIVSWNGHFFVSISDDGTAKMFSLSNETLDNDHRQDGGTIKPASPSVTQRWWTRLFPNKLPQDSSQVTFSVTGEKILDVTISQNNDQIAACTDRGTLKVWNLHGDTLINHKAIENGRLQSVAFIINKNNKKAYLYTVVQSTGVLIIIDAENGNYVSQFNLQIGPSKIISLHRLPDEDGLVVLTETKVVVVKWSWADETNTINRFVPREIVSVSDRKTVLTCAALTYDGEYLVVADSGGSVNVWTLKQGFGSIATYQTLVTSLDTYRLDEECCHLICGSGQDRLVHRWRFEMQEKRLSARLPIFDAALNPREQNILAVATSAKTVQVLQNDRILAETRAASEKITSLVIFQSGEKIVYGMENGFVNLFKLKNKKDFRILELGRPVGFLTVLNIGKSDTIVCADGEERLKIWKNAGCAFFVENTGNVIGCYVINNGKHIITVAHGPIIKLWDNTWRLLDVLISETSCKNISQSCLSHSGNMIAIAKENGQLMLFELKTNETVMPRTKELCLLMDQKFGQKLTCCEFSHDDKLLAVGSDNAGNGDILIIDVLGQTVTHQLLLHCNSVKQLYWAPCHVNAPILLSLSRDELAWWNIALLKENQELKRRSRMGSQFQSSQSFNIVSRSGIGIPVNGSQETNGSSLERSQSSEWSFKLDKVRHDNDDSAFGSLRNNNGDRYVSPWNTFKAKDSKRPALLGVVKLNVINAAKVCVSQDFNNFVTIDGEGSIYNLTLFA